MEDGWNVNETAFTILSPEAKRITGQAIRATKAEVICLQEVENLDTLKKFRTDYLGGRKAYPYALSIDGNDPRLIDVAVLSKHSIVHARSYAFLRHGNSALFSRDCLEVDLLVGSKRLTLFVQHYKSIMGGRKKTRPRRAIQVSKTKEIIRDRVSRRGEFRPPALAEPDVTVSRHPAPIVQPSGRAPIRQWANRLGSRR